MNSGAIGMTLVIVIIVAVTAYLVGTLARSIQNEKSTRMKVLKNFGLSISFCVLFFVSWLAQGIAQWQHYTDEQRDHGEPAEIGDFVSDFSSSTLENWQSEFLQLFSFTIMAAVLIHKGSAESKDSDDRLEAAILRIENKLGTAPTLQEPDGIPDEKDIHVVPDSEQGWALVERGTSEPEGYYDTQDEAITAGRELAGKNGVKLVIHGQDYKVRDETSPAS